MIVTFDASQSGIAQLVGSLACNGWVSVQVFGPSGGVWVGRSRANLESVISGYSPETRKGFYVETSMGIKSIPMAAGDIYVLNGSDATRGDQDKQWACVEVSNG